MDPLSTFHRSRLPHYTPVGGTFFVTFRVHNALPLRLMQGLRFEYEQVVQQASSSRLPATDRNRLIAQARYKYFRSYDSHLDGLDDSRCYFQDPEVCRCLARRLHQYDDSLYELKAYCIMPNHVHVLLSLANQTTDTDNFFLADDALSLSYQPLSEIMRRVKGASARDINLYLDRKGTFWQKDSYDHYVRNAKAYENILYYILYNPVKAGLVSEWREYPFTFHA